MLIPVEELKILYARAIRDVAWEEPQPLPQATRYQAGLVFRKGRQEFQLSFDAVASPEIMTLQATIPFAGGRQSAEALRRRALRLNAETPGVKFFLAEVASPLLVCSVEAILASHGRIPNSEVVDAVLRVAMTRLEDALEAARLPSEPLR